MDNSDIAMVSVGMAGVVAARDLGKKGPFGGPP